MKMKLDQLLAQNRILIHDGATGTFLQQLGLPLHHAPETWVLENPAAVFAAAEAYVNAGADIILTCTFGGTSARLQENGLADHAHEINQRAAQLANEAAQGRALVAGSIGPLGRLPLILGGMTYAEAVDQFAAQAQALVLGGVEAFQIESFSDLQEIQAAIEGARQVSNLPILASMSFDTQGKTLTGITPTAAAKELTRLGANVIGANCGYGPWDMASLLREMHNAVPTALLLAKPNAGIPELINGTAKYTLEPARFALLGRDWVRAGARIVGGCCGSTPKYTQALRNELLSQKKTAPG